MNKEYLKYLGSDLWKEKRQEIIRLQKQCRACGAIKNLHVHHGSYHKINGEEKNKNLFLLCGDCHFTIHELLIQIRKIKGAMFNDLLKITKTYVKQFNRRNKNGGSVRIGRFEVTPEKKIINHFKQTK